MSDLLCAVKCAKRTLLKEKITTRLEAKMGKKLDELADLAVGMFLDKHEHAADARAKKQEAWSKLKDILEE